MAPDGYLARWNLTPDGAPIVTATARLWPVRHLGAPAILKLATVADTPGAEALLRWWAGDGAARVLAGDPPALLLERATGSRSLAAMAGTGEDDAACRILCAVAARLHAPRGPHPPGLTPLAVRFAALAPAAATQGGILARCEAVAAGLLAEPREIVPLHGDLHHGNVLDFGPRGWLAIDPHALLGERGFDHAVLFANPDLADPAHPVATLPGRLQHRLAVVAAAARLERTRLLRWVLAWAGLSAAWFLEDGQSPATTLALAALAAAELDRAGAAATG